MFLYEEETAETQESSEELERLLNSSDEDTAVQIRAEIEKFERSSARSSHSGRIVLITLAEKETLRTDEIEQAVFCMDNAIHTMLRRSDVCLRYSSMQFVLLLGSVNDEESRIIVDRVFSRYYREVGVKGIVPNYSVRKLQGCTDEG